MTEPDRIQELIDDYLAGDPDAIVRNLRGGWRFPGGPLPERESVFIAPDLLCPSCERNAITLNGRCAECQWAVS